MNQSRVNTIVYRSQARAAVNQSRVNTVVYRSQARAEVNQSQGEHRANPSRGESESGEGGEESGAQFALNETFDSIRAGARLVLSYDSTANAFTGTVENTTEDTLRRVRVEVHLSNGIELGPTTPADLAPGETVDITLPASSQPFTSWSAHPEVD